MAGATEDERSSATTLRTERLREREVHNQAPKKTSVQVAIAQHATTARTSAGAAQVHRQAALLTFRPQVGAAKDPQRRRHKTGRARSALSLEASERPRDDRRAARPSGRLILRRRRRGAVHFQRAELIWLHEVVDVARLQLLPLRAIEPDVDTPARGIASVLDHLLSVLRRDSQPGRGAQDVREIQGTALLN